MKSTAQRAEVAKSRSSFDLRFPTLPVESPVSLWLDNSGENMAALTDDSSVDDNVSSVGDSTWDIIDEGSARSDDEDHAHRNLPVDELEVVQSVQATEAQSGRNDTKTEEEEQDIRKGYDEIHAEGSSERNRSSPSESGGPWSRMDSPHRLQQSHPDPENTMQSLRFKVPTSLIHGDATIQVSRVMHVIGEQPVHDGEPHAPSRSTWKVRMSMSAGNLVLDQPYRVLYIGATEAKQRIMHKLGSALP